MPGPGRPFQSRNQYGVGGQRPGAGRPSDVFKRKCAQLVSRRKTVEFLRQVLDGEDVLLNKNNGQESFGPASLRDRIKVFEILCERAFGKPLTEEPMEDKQVISLEVISEIIRKTRLERGLPPDRNPD